MVFGFVEETSCKFVPLKLVPLPPKFIVHPRLVIPTCKGGDLMYGRRQGAYAGGGGEATRGASLSLACCSLANSGVVLVTPWKHLLLDRPTILPQTGGLPWQADCETKRNGEDPTKAQTHLEVTWLLLPPDTYVQIQPSTLHSLQSGPLTNHNLEWTGDLVTRVFLFFYFSKLFFT